MNGSREVRVNCECDNSASFQSYAVDLYASTSFSEAFHAFEKRARALGYESALYTYIPRVIIDSDFAIKPVFHVSETYCPEYLKHYTEANFEKFDPLIRAVDSGIDQPIEWSGEICKSFTHGEKSSNDVISTSKSYGIKSGVTLPLLSGKHGIAGASFINTESARAQESTNPNIPELILSTRLFHSFVQSNACFKGEFVKTLLVTFSETEKRFLAGLARGKAPSEIAYQLKTTERYLEQVMLKIRRKCSGVSSTQLPTINRNQLLYYAGLLDILEHVD